MPSVIGIPEVVVLIAILLLSLAIVWPAAMICRRIGFSPWLGILAALPLANVLLLWFVALSEWPRADAGPRSV
jgi:hypothetical protein